MSLFPVIICGGSSVHLWPAATRSRPKPFLSLIGEESLFAAAVRRMTPLVGDAAELIVVAGVRHERTICNELTALGCDARLLLEPEPRNSGPAMAAAAVWARTLVPGAIVAVTAADHHIPDANAFQTAVRVAIEEARWGRIVTLGILPSRPSPMFGYIAPHAAEGPIYPVRAFVNRPDAIAAADYIREGYLWNTGNLIARADVLTEEIGRVYPEMIRAVEAAVAGPSLWASGCRLGNAFCDAPEVPIENIVMEKTDRASVLPVDFAWSDVGTWDSVIDGGGGDRGEVLRLDSKGGLVRAGPGVSVAVVGVPDLIVVAERGQVLVTQRDAVARVGDAAKRFVPAHAETPDLGTRARSFTDWIRLRALPLWATMGVSPHGWFHEALDAGGRPLVSFRRARVQPRQVYSYCLAGAHGWPGPWRPLAETAMAAFEASYGLKEGGYRTVLGWDGTVQDNTPLLYDLAFVLTARAHVGSPDNGPLLAFLDTRAQLAGGYIETGRCPYQSNTLMHLFEAFLVWEAIDPSPNWRDRSDLIGRLATERLIDREGGFVREVYDTDWTLAAGPEGRIVEPGHQFEWAYLLQSWAARRGEQAGTEAARRLFAAGCRGVVPRRGVAIDEMDETLSPVRATARLWPQTERLKAALVLAKALEDGRETYLAEASAALAAIQTYVTPEGLWGDRMDETGRIEPGPAPASTLYHLMTAFDALAEASAWAPGFEGPLDLT